MLLKCPNCGGNIRITETVSDTHLKYFCHECEQIVTLNVAADEIHSTSATSVPIPHHVARILIADDAVTFAKVVEDLLYKEGYDVILAHDGVQALKKITEERPDAVILDLFMPKMTGFEVLRALRTNPGYKNYKAIPVLVTSGVYKPAEIEVAQDLGANGFIPKELILESIAYRLRKLLHPAPQQPSPL